ncbi:hypothetical protein FC82_GL001821 [Secundilactobacillus collinoides DSM 20515 = JCM 1123]|uniref:Uncharacterized protein n=1 Tax=Secundilactobacillus collinoides DSM 20515 = JCM 1123 TaxID=1423733 RepID=A0A0R2BFS0_SECCO|nr:hypothetical protein FC82_GL001821 [Secundilactobacillus collinoides DSM 20515 = JCM 1123]
MKPFETCAEGLMLLVSGHKIVSVTAIIPGLMSGCLSQQNSPRIAKIMEKGTVIPKMVC